MFTKLVVQTFKPGLQTCPALRACERGWMKLSLRNLTKKVMAAFPAYIFLLPNILGFLTFTFLPILASFALSFVNWGIIGPAPKWVGLKNYIELLGFHREGGKLVANDPNFWYYVGNTLFLMMAIPIGIIFSLFLALLLNQKLRGIVWFRTIFFLPSICSGVAVCLLWRWIYQPDFGLLNSFLTRLKVPWLFSQPSLHPGWLKIVPNPPAWLMDPAWAKPAIMIMGLWAGLGGYNCLLYLAGLQNIPVELYEAAEIDGASWWHKLWHITWPMLSPTTFFILVMSLIGGFQGGFMAAYMMTQGGPAGSTTTIMYYIYNNAFVWFYMGKAAAIAWILFLFIFALTILNWKIGQKVVHYEYV